MVCTDRLKPNCSHRASKTEIPVVLRSPTQSSSRSPTQNSARAIVKKYRRHVRLVEFKRLKHIVPAVRENDKASEEDILEETVKYIEDLHNRLLERIHSQGLPSRLREVAREGESSGSADLKMEEMRTLLERSLQPELMRRQRQRSEEDKVKVKQLIQASALQRQDRKSFHGSRLE